MNKQRAERKLRALAARLDDHARAEVVMALRELDAGRPLDAIADELVASWREAARLGAEMLQLAPLEDRRAALSRGQRLPAIAAVESIAESTGLDEAAIARYATALRGASPALHERMAAAFDESIQPATAPRRLAN